MTHILRLVVVFFFKQKTAYEMRISDWSSDVCSSDLRPIARLEIAVAEHGGERADLVAFRIAHAIVEYPAQPLDRGHFADLPPLAGADIPIGDQIGRASCRERVCQYV